MENNKIWQEVEENLRKELMDIFEGIEIKKITTSFRSYESKYKIVVFAPADKAEDIISHMSSEGAGIIGNYTVCSFRTEGLGTFMGNDQSNPAVGNKGNLETVNEVRIEMVCEKDKLHRVIDKIYHVHPYEEPAIDIYNITIPVNIKPGKIFRFEFSEAVSSEKLINNIKKITDGFVDSGKYMTHQIKGAVVDYSDEGFVPVVKTSEPILFIKRTKNNFRIEKN
ncbi:MAG: hypothetical protein N2510_00340 [Ignavibacteria bacterium]|nr:hypothetical protein [Ignavibacteria bacterium]